MALNDDQLRVLRTELDAGHPVTGPYSQDDSTAADEVNAVNTPGTQPITVEAFELVMRESGQWGTYRQRADATNPDGTRVNKWMSELMDVFTTRVASMDLRGDDYWSGLLDSCVLEGSLGTNAAEAAKALCDVTESRAQQLSLPRVFEIDVTRARALP